MDIDNFLERVVDPGVELVEAIGGPKVSDHARVFLLAVAQQESGPELSARYQNSPSPSPGPARGFWQFEQGGATEGVLSHAASKNLAIKICATLNVIAAPAAVWRSLEGNDFLAAGFARLLLWTDPYAVPQDEQTAWQCYAERLWRPGKPHPDTWPANWSRAVEAVGKVPAAS